MTLRILSLGGGTQSCALALMSAAGDLPRVDHVIFADTHGELPETYAYIWYLAGILHDADIPLHVVSAGSLESALLVDVPTSENPTPPAHVRNPDGSKGRIGAYRCSYDFKRRLIDRKVKQLCGARGAWKRADVEQWIGFSLDEMSRMKQSEECRCGHKRIGMTRKGEKVRIHTPGCSKCECQKFDRWQVNRWPLIELRMKRHDTIRWFADHGHPTPPRSACWFCPNSGNDRWQLLKAEHPNLWERAVHLDDHIRQGGGFCASGGGGAGPQEPFAGEMYLHRSLIPLRDADLRTDRQIVRDSGQGELFDEDALSLDCSTGVCFT